MAEVLIIGSGGREQALAWKLAQSPKVQRVYVAPGNGGSTGKITNVDIGFTDTEALLKFALEHKISLTVIGQEAASAAGVVDAFHDATLAIFGPTQGATRVESSKAFSKDLMHAQQIPTAAYKNVSSAEDAKAYVRTRKLPIVIKADGLAQGKGVVIAESLTQADTAIDDAMVNKVFGGAGETIVIEDFLAGQEVSVHALCDGKTAVIFPASQDHKQAYDGDTGPNTGGMGVIAPVPWVTDQQLAFVRTHIVEPVLAGLTADNTPFTGCLYPGLMIEGDGVDGINILEFNARFGDPEAEVYMRLLDGDLYDIMMDCALGTLNPTTVTWKKGFAISVVACSPGYPGSYPKGLEISGIDKAEAIEGVVVFHAGTAITEDGKLVSAGGRVLNVTATGQTLDEAISTAYSAIKQIHFDGIYYRTDIGKRVGKQ